MCIYRPNGFRCGHHSEPHGKNREPCGPDRHEPYTERGLVIPHLPEVAARGNVCARCNGRSAFAINGTLTDWCYFTPRPELVWGADRGWISEDYVYRNITCVIAHYPKLAPRVPDTRRYDTPPGNAHTIPPSVVQRAVTAALQTLPVPRGQPLALPGQPGQPQSAPADRRVYPYSPAQAGPSRAPQPLPQPPVLASQRDAQPSAQTHRYDHVDAAMYNVARPGTQAGPSSAPRPAPFSGATASTTSTPFNLLLQGKSQPPIPRTQPLAGPLGTRPAPAPTTAQQQPRGQTPRPGSRPGSGYGPVLGQIAQDDWMLQQGRSPGLRPVTATTRASPAAPFTGYSGQSLPPLFQGVSSRSASPRTPVQSSNHRQRGTPEDRDRERRQRYRR